jgi:hypothetical protein
MSEPTPDEPEKEAGPGPEQIRVFVSIASSWSVVMENYVRHVLVTDQTGPVGMVSARDLLGAYVA